MWAEFVNKNNHSFTLRKEMFVSLNECELIQKLDLNVEVVSHEYGDCYQIPNIRISGTSVEFRKIGLLLIYLVLGNKPEFVIPINENDGLIKEIIFFAAKRPHYPVSPIEIFEYTQSAIVKRHPWHPWPKNKNPLFGLPSFGWVLPAQANVFNELTKKERPKKSYPIKIGGYPKGLLRLAQLLFDYANSGSPPEEIDLEVEGGFRGVAPVSYEARFSRMD